MSLSPKKPRKVLSPRGSVLQRTAVSPRSVVRTGGTPSATRTGGALRTFTVTGARFYEVKEGKKHSIPKGELEKLIGAAGIAKVKAGGGKNVQIDIGEGGISVPVSTTEKKSPVSPKKGKSPPRKSSLTEAAALAEEKGGCRPKGMEKFTANFTAGEVEYEVYTKKACCPPVTNLIGKILYRSDDEARLAGKIPNEFSRTERIYRMREATIERGKLVLEIKWQLPNFLKPLLTLWHGDTYLKTLQNLGSPRRMRSLGPMTTPEAFGSMELCWMTTSRRIQTRLQSN
jgi:hypothetical protein